MLITAVKMRLDEYVKAFNNNDSALWDHFYTKDACLVPPGYQMICKGKMGTEQDELYPKLKLKIYTKPPECVDLIRCTS